MHNSFVILLFIILVVSCEGPTDSDDNQHYVEMGDTLSNYENDSSSNDTKLADSEKAITELFTWSFIEGQTERGDLQVDIALIINQENRTDTAKFFTARGKWNVLDVIDNGIKEFPSNCITAVESKAENYFWAIRELEENKYEILFGGVENGTALAVLDYGFLNLQNNGIDYEVGSPEEIETYTRYGTSLY